MHLSSLSIGSDLLVSLEDHFYQRLLSVLNRKFNCIRCELPSVHVTSIHLSYNIKEKELQLSFCGIPISSKKTNALHYSGTTF